MSDKKVLTDVIKDRFSSLIENLNGRLDIVTMELSPTSLLEVCDALRDEAPFHFELLLDICGVDYLKYGISEWRTEETTNTSLRK